MRRLASKAVEKTLIITKLIFPSVNMLFQVQFAYHKMEEDESILREEEAQDE